MSCRQHLCTHATPVSCHTQPHTSFSGLRIDLDNLCQVYSFWVEKCFRVSSRECAPNFRQASFPVLLQSLILQLCAKVSVRIFFSDVIHTFFHCCRVLHTDWAVTETQISIDNQCDKSEALAQLRSQLYCARNVLSNTVKNFGRGATQTLTSGTVAPSIAPAYLSCISTGLWLVTDPPVSYFSL